MDDDPVVGSGQRDKREAELRELQRRIGDEVDELEACNIWVLTSGLAGDGTDEGATAVEVEVAAPREDYAQSVMTQRYGSDVHVVWLADAPTAEEAVSWTTYEAQAERELLVNYTATLGCEPARVAVQETPTSVTITVYERCPVHGAKPLPTARSAIARLHQPLEDRRVMDGSR